MTWDDTGTTRLAAIREALADVSTSTAFHMLCMKGWRNTYMQGLLPLSPLGLGRRLVGRARTVRYLARRAPELPPPSVEVREANRQARAHSPEVVAIESLEPGDILCIDALGVRTAGIIGDILATRIKARGALAAVIHGAVRDTPFVREVGLPVFCAGAHPSASGRDVIAVDQDVPIDMGGCHVVPGDILLADDEGVVAMPLELAEFVAAHGPAKEHLELWIRDKIAAGGSVRDYYPPSPEREAEYTRETGRSVHHA